MIAVVDRNDDYACVRIRGRVVEMIEGEEADRQIDRLVEEVHGQRRVPGAPAGRIARQGRGRARIRPVTSLLFLSRATVRDLLPDVHEQLDLVEQTYRALAAAGRIELPPKPGVHPRKDSFLHAMPAYLRDEDVVTLKWVGGYPANKERGLPYITGLIVVNDAETGYRCGRRGRGRGDRGLHRRGERRLRAPLRSRGLSRAAILGCGEQGIFHARLLHALNPGASRFAPGTHTRNAWNASTTSPFRPPAGRRRSETPR